MKQPSVLAIVPALAVLLAPQGASCLHAQVLLNETPGAPFGSAPGLIIDVMGDIDGDGLDDLLVSSYGPDIPSQAGAVSAVSGASLAVLYQLHGDSAGDGLYVIAALGDVNGDGVRDFVAGAATDDDFGTSSGSARICSGSDGSVLQMLYGAKLKNHRFGIAVANAGDVDGDGLDDVIIGATGATGGGAVFVYSSAGWHLLHVLGSYNESNFGISVAGAGDVDGDGFHDVAAAQSSPPIVRVYSGAYGSVIRELHAPTSAGSVGVRNIGDADADGVPDLAMAQPTDSTGGVNRGSVSIHSGATGVKLLELHGDHPSDFFGSAVAPAGDVDGDGHADVAATGRGSTYGVVRVHSGADGGELVRLEGKPFPNYAFFGQSISPPCNLNGDGFPDFAVSAFGDLPTSDYIRTFTNRYRLHNAAPDKVLFTNPGPMILVGGGFEAGSPIEVTLGGVPATGVTWVSSKEIHFVAPPGPEDADLDLVYTQEGLSVVVPDAIHYEGVRILDVNPGRSALEGGTKVTLWGRHFPDDGSVQVYFFTNQGQGVSVYPPDRIDVITPPMGPESPDNIKVVCSNGSDTFKKFVYTSKYVDVERGNITGGTAATLHGVPGHAPGTYKVLFGFPGVEAQLLPSSGSSINILTPPVAEPTGTEMELLIFDPVFGNEKVKNKWTYTPALTAAFTTNGFGGGRLAVTWVTDPAVTTPQLVTLWFGLPGVPQIQAKVGGIAGLLRELPFLFFFVGLAEPGLPQTMEFQVDPYAPVGSAMQIHLQGLVSGEGGLHGSFTNVATFTLP